VILMNRTLLARLDIDDHDCDSIVRPTTIDGLVRLVCGGCGQPVDSARARNAGASPGVRA
jgi:hypothetical protein